MSRKELVNSISEKSVLKALPAARSLAGANPNARFRDDDTLLIRAVDSFEMVSFLIAAGAEIAGESGRTALSTVARYPYSNEAVDCIAKRIRQQDAVLLLDWMIALAPI
jgi:hypothetical protein